ncbi:MAG TPA: hypothetical protein VKZ50_05795 [bacterium]|nr:hypothetical protein [bacterium]
MMLPERFPKTIEGQTLRQTIAALERLRDESIGAAKDFLAAGDWTVR